MTADGLGGVSGRSKIGPLSAPVAQRLCHLPRRVWKLMSNVSRSFHTGSRVFPCFIACCICQTCLDHSIQVLASFHASWPAAYAGPPHSFHLMFDSYSLLAIRS